MDRCLFRDRCTPWRDRADGASDECRFGYSFACASISRRCTVSGNDFIVFDAPAGQPMLTPEQFRAASPTVTPASALIRRWCSSRRAAPDTAVFYRIFNSDGARSRAVRQRRALHRRACSIAAGARTDRCDHDGQPGRLIHARITAR